MGVSGVHPLVNAALSSLWVGGADGLGAVALVEGLPGRLYSRPVLFGSSTELERVGEALSHRLQHWPGQLLGLVAYVEDALCFVVRHVALPWPAPHDSLVTVVRVVRPRREDLVFIHFLLRFPPHEGPPIAN